MYQYLLPFVDFIVLQPQRQEDQLNPHQITPFDLGIRAHRHVHVGETAVSWRRAPKNGGKTFVPEYERSTTLQASASAQHSTSCHFVNIGVLSALPGAWTGEVWRALESSTGGRRRAILLCYHCAMMV